MNIAEFIEIIPIRSRFFCAYGRIIFGIEVKHYGAEPDVVAEGSYFSFFRKETQQGELYRLLLSGQLFE